MISFINYGAVEFIEFLLSFIMLAFITTSFLYGFKYFIYAILKK